MADASTGWMFPPVSDAEPEGIVAVGADLEPATILSAYCAGLFPMPVEPGGPIGWWSPDPRAVLELDQLYVSTSTKKAIRKYCTTVNTAFAAVMAACGDPDRPHGWIDQQMFDAYNRLHAMGWAHSVEVWEDDADPAGPAQLVGGVYGLGIGSFFAGESMFHRRTNASKVALARLVAELRAAGVVLFDVQWQTDHLASMGVIEIDRDAYVERLRAATIEKTQLALGVHDLSS